MRIVITLQTVQYPLGFPFYTGTTIRKEGSERWDNSWPKIRCKMRRKVTQIQISRERLAQTVRENELRNSFRGRLSKEEGRSTARRGYETRVTKLVTEFQIGCFATILPAYRGIPFWPKREDRLRIESSSVQEMSPIACNFVDKDKDFNHSYIYIYIREIDRVHAFGRILLEYYII